MIIHLSVQSVPLEEELAFHDCQKYWEHLWFQIEGIAADVLFIHGRLTQMSSLYTQNTLYTRAHTHIVSHSLGNEVTVQKKKKNTSGNQFKTQFCHKWLDIYIHYAFRPCQLGKEICSAIFECRFSLMLALIG